MGLITVVTMALYPQLTFAQAPAPAAPVSSSTEVDKVYQSVATFLTVILEFLQRIMWPILLLIGGLMKNDILFDAGMSDLMLSIWANVRNIVNILFVLALLILAFINVMGLAQSQNYQVKAILPKFIIALIAVNFSYLAVKIILDGINVVSTAIFAMPPAVQENLGKDPFSTKEKQNDVCKGFYGKEESRYQAAIQEAGDTALCDTSYAFTDKAKNFFAAFDANNSGIVMAINLAQIAKIDTVKVTMATVKNLALNMLFSVTFYVVYATAFVALFVVLLARLVVLWITIVLSPLVVLPYVLPEKIKGALGEAGKLQEMFVKHAIVPIPIAFVMTIGFIMLDGLQKTKFASFSNLTNTTASIDFLTSGLSTLQEIIVAAGMVGIVWTGVFAATKDTIAHGLTEGIKGAVGGAGKFLATSWKYAPLFPVTGVKDEQGHDMKISLAGAKGMLEEFPTAKQQKAREEGRKMFETISGQKSNEIANRLEKAKDYSTVQQELANAKSQGLPGSKRMQEALSRSMEGSPDVRAKIMATLPAELKDASGQKFDKKDLEKKLKAGQVGEDTMRQIAELHSKGITPEPEKPEQEKATAKPGEAKEGAILDEDAKRAIEHAGGGAYMAALHPDKKKKLDAYSKSKVPKDKEKALQDAQDSLKELNNLENQGGEFKAKARKAADEGNAEELDKLIATRREELKKSGIVGDPADAILRIELEPINERAKVDPKAKAAIEGSKAGTLDGNATKSASDILKLTPVAPVKVEAAVAPAPAGKPAAKPPAAPPPAAPKK